MKLSAACTSAVLALLLAGVITSNAQRDYRDQSLELLRLLAMRPWSRDQVEPAPRWEADADMDRRLPDETSDDDGDVELRMRSNKRSAVATALNTGRRRRQPTPALGVLNNVGTFLDSLRDNLETLASLSPAQRSTLFQEPPTVMLAPSSGGGGGAGGGSGMRRFHALRPLRPTNIRSHNRRSVLEAAGVYPGANRHDPGLLWTGLGR